MSGGVDSSVAAAILKEEGYDVIGITMHVWSDFSNPACEERKRSCCAPSHIDDARQVAHQLGIPHYVLDFRADFDRLIVDYFCQEYLNGKTPNPCIPCNQKLKFVLLAKRVKELGAQYIATGHYAQIQQDNEGNFLLKSAKDKNKDQSYFLFNLKQKQLKHTLFPLGNFTKARIRRLAGELNLKVANKPDSQQVCFTDQHYQELLKERFPERIKKGVILDYLGHKVGEHKGIHLYTIGQRKGLGLALGYPVYVTEIDSIANTIKIGAYDDLYSDSLIAQHCHMAYELSHSKIVQIKIRSRHKAAKAIISPLDNGKIKVKFARPQRAITPGQAAVFYAEDCVLGGGWIDV